MNKYFEENKANMERQLEIWAFRILAKFNY